MSVIQAVTISGEMIEKARWEVASLAEVHPGDAMAVSVGQPAKELVAHVQKQGKAECSVDALDGGQVCVTVAFSVHQVRHMVDESGMASMCLIVPASRYAEQVLLYAMAPNRCDRRFSEAIRG